MSDLPCDVEPRPDRKTQTEDAIGFAKKIAGRPLPPADASELLNRAAQHMRDRATVYDKPEGERSMQKAVDAFNTITGHRLRESEGWLFMLILKGVRSETRDAPHQDSLEDLVAYSALFAESRGAGR